MATRVLRSRAAERKGSGLGISLGILAAGIGLLAAFTLLADDAAATHYRYGTLSWTPTGSGNEVVFTGAQAWRHSAFGNPPLGSLVGVGPIDTGDGGSVPLTVRVDSINPINDWFFGAFVDGAGNPGIPYTYSAPDNGGAPWVAFWSSCCRISPVSSGNFHVNNPDQSMALETLVDVDDGNASPRTNLPPINSCPLNALCSIPIPVAEPDGDVLSYRLATTAEAGDFGYVAPGPPDAPNGATIGVADGIVRWDTTGATYDASYHTLYSIQVMLEDGQTKTPLDFFIELIPPGVSPPQWDAPTPCGVTLSAGPGATVSFTVQASNPDPARIVYLNHLGLPPGASFPLPPGGNPVSSVFTWTPVAGQEGTYIVIFTAVDDRGYSAVNCPVTIVVPSHPPPQFIPPSPCGLASALEGIEGVPLSFSLAANSTNLSRTVTLSMISGPAGLGFSPGPAGNPTTGSANWPLPVQGLWTALFRATDSGGQFSQCIVFLDVLRPEGQAFALSLWAGTAAPASAEYRTSGAELAAEGSVARRHAVVDLPTYGAYADAVEETASIDVTTGQASSSAGLEIAEVRLLGGLVVVEAVESSATLSWDALADTSTLTTEWAVGRLTVGATVVPVDPASGPVTVPLPGGGTLVLFESETVDLEDGALYRSNLLHLYAPAAYGRHEVIVGSLLLQAGDRVEPLAQERLILPQDDARTGGDAPSGTAGAPVLAPGLYDAATPGTDLVDTYAVGLLHGEKVAAVVGPAPRVEGRGGSAQVDETPPPGAAPPSTAVGGSHSYRLELYDPTGALREWSQLATATGLPQRVELNADLDGLWNLRVTRTTTFASPAVNYSLALSVTPLVLLPQMDALGPGDAPGACDPSGLGIPLVDNGTWPGVVRDDDFVDVYRFEAAIGELVTLVLKPGEDVDGVDMALTLYDRNCSFWQRSNILGTGSGAKGAPEAGLVLPSPYTGRWFAAIERLNGVGNHYLTVSVQDPMPSLPANDALTGSDAPTSWTAGPAAPAPVFQGELPEGDPGDGYRLDLQAGRDTVVTVTASATSRLDVRLFRPDGTQVGATLNVLSGQEVVFRFTPGATGFHGLEVRPLLGGGDYLVAFAQGR